MNETIPVTETLIASELIWLRQSTLPVQSRSGVTQGADLVAYLYTAGQSKRVILMGLFSVNFPHLVSP